MEYIMKSATIKNVLSASFLTLALIAAAAPSAACANGPHHNAASGKPIIVIKNALKRVKGKTRATVSIKIKQHNLSHSEIRNLLDISVRGIEGAVNPKTVKKGNGTYNTRWANGGEVLKERVFNIK